MDEFYERFCVLDLDATEPLFPGQDLFGDIRQFLIGKPADPPGKILGTFCKMVGDRRQDRVELVS